MYHDFTKMHICVDAFMRSSTRPSFVKAIKDISVDKSLCFDEKDRITLRNKVKSYYESQQSFEEFVKMSAIALLTVGEVRLASRHGTDASDLNGLDVWISLSIELRFDELADALKKATPRLWREDSMRKDRKSWQNIFNQHITTWFAECVVPVLDKKRKTSVRKRVLAGVKIRKSIRRSHTIYLS